MSTYSNREYTDMILSLGVCGGNASAAADHYRHRYPNRRHPDRRVIQRAKRTLGEYGSFEKLRRHGGRRRRVSINVEEQIVKDVLEHPDISARKLSLRYNLSCFTILRILHENNLHAYHITRGLMPHDKISRKAFCHWLLQQHTNDAEFLLKILWTDEAKFTRDGMFNVHNMHNWQNENPHSILETHFHVNVNVWAGIIGHLIIGPYFFEGNVTSAAYFDFLQNKLPELLEDVPLRTRGSLILQQDGAPSHFSRHHAVNAAAKLKKNRPQETGLTSEGDIEIFEIDEGMEPEEFINALGQMNKKLYVSLEKDQLQEHTPRLFHLSSISKEFKSVEMLCPHRASLPTPFPFLQEDLYQVHQPALFLLDNKNELWIWQGWWPNTGAEDQSGSKAVRWQAERRAAMTMAMQYWQRIHPETNKYPIYLVWAGLEPLQFINLFPTWTYRDDIAELNIEDGRNPGEVLTVESELIRLTQSTYPPAQLLQRPLPEGVDPTHLELYLSQQHFQEILGMTKEEFQELPVWRQVNLKKEIGLF